MIGGSLMVFSIFEMTATTDYFLESSFTQWLMSVGFGFFLIKEGVEK